MELKFLFFLLIILPYIYGRKIPKRLVKEMQQLNEYAKEGTPIADNSLILYEDGFLGEGSVGFLYAGILKKDRHPVAIKFVRKANSKSAQEEIEILKKLKAYKNPQIEKKGFPNVYYYGNWSSYILTAMTKLDVSLWDIQEKEEKLHTQIIRPLDMLILFRNFVIQTKYMHDKGISHGSVHSWHIMLGLKRSFIIDFKESHEMKKEARFELTHEDWRSFIRMTAMFYGIEYCDYWKCFKEKLHKRILDNGLKRVIEKFGDEAFSTNHPQRLLKYDHLEEFINKEIKEKRSYLGSTPLKNSCLSNWDRIFKWRK